MCYESSIFIYDQAWLPNSDPFVCSDYKPMHDIPASSHEWDGIRVDCDSCNAGVCLQMIFLMVRKSEGGLDGH